ncbi:MAG TPA: Mpo1-like protein [Caulobacterales bacterium]|nr:Mpo1-like protein [Caulobacterales bacterium]
MPLGRIVSDQIADYPRVHRSRTILKIHLLAVPMFWAGLIALLIAAITTTLSAALVGAALLVLSIALQGWAHAQEPEKPAPFKSPLEFLIRITTENLYVFPRYVLSGAWRRAWLLGT